MSDYIEREEAGQPLDPYAVPSSRKTDAQINSDRWSWLVNGWATMTWEEKFALFNPKTIYVYPPTQVSTGDVGAYVTERTMNAVYKYCRSVNAYKFAEANGTPGVLIVLSPIDVRMVPNETIRTEMKAWYATNILPGFVASEEQTIDSELLKLVRYKY